MTIKQKQKFPQRSGNFTAAMMIALCVSVFAVPNVSSAAAAETDSEDIGKPTTATSETNKPQDSNDKQAGTNKDTNGKAKDREIFRPSEEISEDFAVSFPVDI